MRTLRLLALTVALNASLLPSRAAGQASFATLYKFDTLANGEGPMGVVAAGGALYGATQTGGRGPGTYGVGTIFELDPPGPAERSAGGGWTEKVLYSFTGENGDGTYPYASPVFGAHGALYGTTSTGGTVGYGTAFELRPPAARGGAWTETVLHSFTFQNGDGAGPSATLVFGEDGAIYGTTFYGGASGYGIVFELRPPAAPGTAWAERVLYSFTAGGDGGNPGGLAMGPNGVLYGTTLVGGAMDAGTVFELLPPATPGGAWTETVLHSFIGDADGVYPVDPPVVTSDGTLYGSTTGTIDIDGYPGLHGLSTVFALTPEPGGNWSKTLLATFGYGDGEGVCSTLIERNGTIYGASGKFHGGEFFELQPPAAPGGRWTKTILHTFPEGSTPTGRIVMDESGAIYGATIDLSQTNTLAGTVYRIRP
jgi:uncharacterized repeat protein (TIGR03803 family)